MASFSFVVRFVESEVNPNRFAVTVSSLDFVQIMRQLLRLPGTHELKYKLSGSLELGRFRGKKIPFDFQGELSQEAMFGSAGD